MRAMFATDFKSEPYWWDQTPRPKCPAVDLPSAIDVAVVGSGYTGLNAALVTARAGRSTLVFDAGDAGFGCSTRNGGQISTSVKPSLAELTQRYGSDTATALIAEGHAALVWIGEFIDREKIDCSFAVPGRFHAAHNPKAFDRLVRQVENQPRGLEVPFRIVARGDQQAEIGTDRYHGGIVFEKHASLDPARYHQGLYERVLGAGGTIAAHCRVTSIERQGEGFLLCSEMGETRARDVVIATNGYTSGLTPWLRRRVIPIGSYVIATEPIDADLMDRIMPTNRIVSDSRKVVYYYRPSPDRTRIVIRRAGVQFRNRHPTKRPSAENARSTSCSRTCAAQGSATAGWALWHTRSTSWPMWASTTACTTQWGFAAPASLWRAIRGCAWGQRVVGASEGRSAFETVPMTTRPLYYGHPWFLPASVACSDFGTV